MLKNTLGHNTLIHNFFYTRRYYKNSVKRLALCLLEKKNNSSEIHYMVQYPAHLF